MRTMVSAGSGALSWLMVTVNVVWRVRAGMVTRPGAVKSEEEAEPEVVMVTGVPWGRVEEAASNRTVTVEVPGSAGRREEALISIRFSLSVMVTTAGATLNPSTAAVICTVSAPSTMSSSRRLRVNASPLTLFRLTGKKISPAAPRVAPKSPAWAVPPSTAIRASRGAAEVASPG